MLHLDFTSYNIVYIGWCILIKNLTLNLNAIYVFFNGQKKGDEGLLKGTELVELTSPHFFNENLQLLLAKTYISLDEKEKARDIANELITKNLLKEESEKLLEELN